MTAQQTAPAKANREYRLTGLSGVASLGAVGTPIVIDLRAEVVGRVKLSDNLEGFVRICRPARNSFVGARASELSHPSQPHCSVLFQHTRTCSPIAESTGLDFKKLILRPMMLRSSLWIFKHRNGRCDRQNISDPQYVTVETIRGDIPWPRSFICDFEMQSSVPTQVSMTGSLTVSSELPKFSHQETEFTWCI